MLYLRSVGRFHSENVIGNDFLASLDTGVDPVWGGKQVKILERRTTLMAQAILPDTSVFSHPDDTLRNSLHPPSEKGDAIAAYTTARSLK